MSSVVLNDEELVGERAHSLTDGLGVRTWDVR